MAVVYVHSACVNTYCGVFVNANWRFCSLSECDPNDVDSAADRYCERFYVYCFKTQVNFLSKIFLGHNVIFIFANRVRISISSPQFRKSRTPLAKYGELAVGKTHLK